MSATIHHLPPPEAAGLASYHAERELVDGVGASAKDDLIRATRTVNPGDTLRAWSGRSTP